MCPLDEQEQIDQLRISMDEISCDSKKIMTLLLGDKLKDPDARSLIDDVQANRRFRISIEKKVNKIAAILGASILGLFVKSFWASFIKLIAAGKVGP